MMPILIYGTSWLEHARYCVADFRLILMCMPTRFMPSLPIQCAASIRQLAAPHLPWRLLACITCAMRLPQPRVPLPPVCRWKASCKGLRLSIPRSEEHTSELQSLMRISYAVLCLKQKKHNTHILHHYQANANLHN